MSPVTGVTALNVAATQLSAQGLSVDHARLWWLRRGPQRLAMNMSGHLRIRRTTATKPRPNPPSFAPKPPQPPCAKSRAERRSRIGQDRRQGFSRDQGFP